MNKEKTKLPSRRGAKRFGYTATQTHCCNLHFSRLDADPHKLSEPLRYLMAILRDLEEWLGSREADLHRADAVGQVAFLLLCLQRLSQYASPAQMKRAFAGYKSGLRPLRLQLTYAQPLVDALDACSVRRRPR